MTMDVKTKMNPEAKELWLTELLEGGWTQTQGHLGNASDRGRCCLGVLCEVAVKQGVIPPPVISAANADHEPWLRYDEEMSLLPAKVRRWAGIDSNPIVYGWGNARSLAELNDGEGGDSSDPTPWSFEQIAAAIKEEL